MDAGRVGCAPSASTSLCAGALAESSERYSSMFTYHPHAAYSLDRSGHYTDANPRALAMTGLSLQQMRETHFSQVIHPEDAHIIQEGVDRALAGVPQLVDARVLRADGQVVEIRCTMIPVVVGGQVVGVHGVTEDVTDAKQVLRQLEEANAAKALFLANVSHEVRTPLASVTDTGVGIAEDHLHALFEPFTQADPSATRGYEGVGLGLAICRDLVDLMGGQLQTFSMIGEGSTFTFGVPLGHFGEDRARNALDAALGPAALADSERTEAASRD